MQKMLKKSPHLPTCFTVQATGTGMMAAASGGATAAMMTGAGAGGTAATTTETIGAGATGGATTTGGQDGEALRDRLRF